MPPIATYVDRIASVVICSMLDVYCCFASLSQPASVRLFSAICRKDVTTLVVDPMEKTVLQGLGMLQRSEQ
uniref:Secreted protein n=1 Tax=Ascaris lumbricoides TaxID=6252 RepID=A0A0M3HI56_ASCLU